MQYIIKENPEYLEIKVSDEEKLNEFYAVKIITKNYSLSLEDQSPFHWEMDISQLLTHIYDDNIIKIYDTFESVDHCYIVMEILQGD